MQRLAKKRKTEYEKISRMIDMLYRYDYRSYNFQSTSMWCVERIDWAWKFRKITKEQMEELTDKMLEILE